LGEGYTLVVCEKPDAARRISESLAETRVERLLVEGTEVLRFKRGGEEFVVGAALGHIYGVSDPFGERGVYPVFDVEWYPSNVLEERLSFAKGRIESFRKLSLGAVRFINACDYDVEGETIGFNILRYACGGKEREALRAKFSTLTKEDLLQAFQNARSPSSDGLAVAGRTRHEVDFIWGVNLSRALSEAAQRVGSPYKTLSIGRVQGPTLSYVIDREVEIRTFVPEPFWAVKGVFRVGGTEFEGRYAVERITRKADAERVEEGCRRHKGGVVSKASRGLFEETPPAPFNTGDLQREAYRVFGYAPARTLQIAERLYLDALVSYPRTNSQKLPPSIGYAKIFEGLRRMEQYSREAGELGRGVLRPKEGSKYDTAHPAVYPTGERPRRALPSWEARLLDLVIRRFMATFAPNAVRERASAVIMVGEYEFRASGTRTVNEGWLRYYGKYSGREEKPLPILKEGDEVRVVSIESTEEFTSPPPRYNQSSLLDRMERENLGTKATRSEIISTLISRGYIVVVGEQVLTATDLGFAVMETMKAYSPAVASTRLTREIEAKLEEIEGGGGDASALLGQTIKVMSDNLLSIASNEERIGREMSAAISSAIAARYILGPCPVCKTGKLKIVRSRKTRKRFVGCTNYPNACNASAPLPQRGAIRTTTRACGKCGWPIVYVKLGRFPWKLCVNPRCPSKVGRKEDEMQAVQLEPQKQ
jgi:DNA topoisomerase-1